MPLDLLILAAGASTRFKTAEHHFPKQLAWLGQETVLQHTMNLCRQLSSVRIHVVLGCEAEILQSQINNMSILINPKWQEGLGSSIAYGVKHLPENSSGVLLVLCDQLALKFEELKILVDAFETQIYSSDLSVSSKPAIICAAYAGIFGVPAVFPKIYFTDLIALSGDQGAKIILEKYSCIKIPVPSAAFDLDTQEDLKFYLQQNNSLQKSDLQNNSLQNNDLQKKNLELATK